MKYGILPLFDRAFISDGNWVKPFLSVAEAAGCDSVWTVEHPLMAENYEPLYPYSPDGRAPIIASTVMPDPLEWLAYAAAVTETLRLGTGVVLLPLHSPIILAKRAATIDALSGGRLMLGVGLGWQREEFAAIGVPYGERGRRMDEGIAALRALWTESPASFDGSYYKFTRVHSDPKPARATGIPILVGGSTDVAATRAGRVGDGYFPHAISPDDMALRLETMRQAAIAAGRDPNAIEVTVSPVSWKHHGSADLDLVRAYAALGVSRLVIGAYEADGTTAGDIERFIKSFRDTIIARL